ncbi:beta strand repeat-containing protein [Massilia sp. BHUDP2]|uniref:beta strand repeat-containing protein n=1 Tax=Massilia sp. BHUDP2 TaxID=3034505 RepID=UPI0039066317
MATKILSVSFANGFVGDYSKSTEAKSASYLKDLGWSNFQFQQVSESSQFTLQGNDLTGRILITDAAGKQHTIDAVINWRTPSGDVSTMVAYATGSTAYTLATTTGTLTIAPLVPNAKNPAHTFLGLTFNGRTLDIQGGMVSGNAAANNVLGDLNTYLANQPQLTVSDISVDEDSGMATVTVTLSKASTDTISVKYATQDGTAAQGKDYIGTSGVLTFGAQQTSASFQVPLIGNKVVDGARSLDIVLSDSMFAAIVDNVGVLTITDNDTTSPPPAAQSVAGIVADGAGSVTEGGSLTFVVTLSAASGSENSHAFTLGGQAGGLDLGTLVFSNGVTLVNGKLVVPAGVASFTVTVPTIDDVLIEGAESVVLGVGGKTATGTIVDNDTQKVAGVTVQDAAIGADPADTSVTEGAALRYTVTLNAASPAATEYAVAFGGTATDGDRGALSFSANVAWKNGDAATGIVVVPAGVTVFHATLATVDDTLIEETETVTLIVGGISATGTLLDNDSQSVSGVLAEDAAHTGAAPTDSAVVEGASLLYTVSLSAASPVPSEHTLAVSGTASAADFQAFVFSNGVTWKNNNPQSGIVVVPAGVTAFSVKVPTVDDFDIEAAETLVLTIGGKSAAGTITDNDSQSVSGVLAEDAAHTGAAPVDSSVEEGGKLLYTVALSGASPTPSEHTLAVAGTAGAGDRGAFVFSDGVAWKNGDVASGIVIVPANVATFTVLVPTVDDTLIEGAETLVLTVGGVAATGTILDNDSQAVAAVVAEDAAHTGAAPVDSTVEEGEALLYTVTLNGASPAAVEHTLAISGTAGSADRGALVFSDGVAWKNNDAQSGIVVVPPGVGSFTIRVATVDDSAVESAESLVLTVGGVAATGTIADNDRPSVVSVLAEDAAQAGALPVDSAVVEGGTLQYTVLLSAAGATQGEFLLGLGGTAGRLDHAALVFSDGVAWKNGEPATGIVVVPAGVGSFRITVATTDDSAVELAESLAITVGGVTGTGTITDNDSVSVASVIAEDAGQVGLSPVDSVVTEGWILRYTVQLSGVGVADSEFQLAFSGTASAADVEGIVFSDGVDWKDGDAATGLIVVPAGVGSFKITVGTADDDIIELAESLVATVGGVAATGTITDNDSQSVSSLKAEDAANPGALPVDSSVVEGAALLFTATLNGPSPVPTEYALALGGSAGAADLGAISFGQGVAWKNNDPASGAIVVPAGVSTFTVTLQTLDDALVEAAESVVLSIGGVSATGTLTDNDSLAVRAVLAEDAANLGRDPHDSVITEGGTLQYTVTLNGVAPAPTEFTLALGGTASNADLGLLAFSHGVAWKNGDPASGIVVVPAGVAGFSVTLPTVDDELVESSESAVLVVNGVHATGTLLDNDFVPPAPAPQPQPEPTPPAQPAPPVAAPEPVLETGLDPASDDGASNSDRVTSIRTPEFTLQGAQIVAGGSVRLLSPEGLVVGATPISAADALAGRVNVGPGPLDDGVYTYMAQVLDADGKLIASAPVTVTVVTDLDGVMPSVELAAYGGDYNRDGILDWQQNTVALLPLRSLADVALGKDAPVAAFGAILAGSLGAETGAVQLTAGGQLKDLGLTALPAALPQELRAASPVFKFTVEAEDGVPSLPDLDPSRPGLQTRVVIELGLNGVVSNSFMKFDRASQSWYSFLDDQDLSTFDDGATLIDLNNDGRVDRIVITLTDGARGDDDGLVNGTIVDPGLLVFDTTPDKVYSVRLHSGETYYTADIADAQAKSSGTGNVFQGVAFDSMVGAPDAKHVSAFYQPFTQDMSFAVDGQALPYACYELINGSAGFFAAAAGKAAVNIHLWQNASGLTELVSATQARELGLAAKGYTDRGAQFSVDVDNAFKFDAEGYLIANQDNASVQALVKQLAGMYTSTSAAGFVEAVEQNYFEQIKLVGVAHGAAAGAADLNAVFGTGFGS